MLPILPIIGAFFSTFGRNTKKGKIFFTTLFGLFLIIVSSYRDYSVGDDTLNYFWIFINAKNMSYSQIFFEDSTVDFGYLIYNKFLGYFSEDPQIVLIFNAIIINVPILYYLYKNAKNLYFSLYLYIVLYFYSDSLNIMRQFIVISFFLIAMEKLRQKKIFKYILIIIFASTIHASALILILVPLLFYMKPTVLNSVILGSLISIVTVILFVNPNIIYLFAGSYSRYLDTGWGSPAQIGGSYIIVIIQLVLYLLSVFIIYLDSPKLSDENIQMIFVASIMMLISASLGLLRSNIPVVYRLIYYFSFFQVLLIPDIANFLFREKKLVIIIISIAYFIYYVYFTINNVSGVVPYLIAQ